MAFRSSLTTPSDKMFWIRADPESFVKGDPTLTTFVFKVDGGRGREDPSPTLSGPSSARQRNAIKGVSLACR